MAAKTQAAVALSLLLFLIGAGVAEASSGIGLSYPLDLDNMHVGVGDGTFHIRVYNNEDTELLVRFQVEGNIENCLTLPDNFYLSPGNNRPFDIGYSFISLGTYEGEINVGGYFIDNEEPGGTASATLVGSVGADVRFVVGYAENLWEVLSITPEENATMEVENTAITELTISVKNSVENVHIIVQELAEKPATIEIAPPGIAYAYLNIVTKYITDANIDRVTIVFKVEKSWIMEHKIDETTLTLKRYAAGEWTSLPTEKVDEDDTHVYFSAVSPGLSVFAISGTALAPVEFPTVPVVSIVMIVVVTIFATILWVYWRRING